MGLQGSAVQGRDRSGQLKMLWDSEEFGLGGLEAEVESFTKELFEAFVGGPRIDDEGEKDEVVMDPNTIPG